MAVTNTAAALAQTATETAVMQHAATETAEAQHRFQSGPRLPITSTCDGDLLGLQELGPEGQELWPEGQDPSTGLSVDLGGTSVKQFLETEEKDELMHLLLLDSCSSVHSITNKDFLVKGSIRSVPTPLRIRTTAGEEETNLVGIMPTIGWVWYTPNGIANILSLTKMEKVCRISYSNSAF